MASRDRSPPGGSGSVARPIADRRPSYIQFAPKRAMASFENLVALANHQERLREARKIIWRDRGEPVVDLGGLRECHEHAGKGAIRASLLAFNMRAGVNLFLLLFRLKKIPRNRRFALIRHAVLGSDPFRFAAMLGSFVYIYKFLLNALPLLFPDLGSGLPTYAPTFDDDEPATNATRSRSRTRKPALAPLTPAKATSERKARLSLSAHAQLQMVRKKTHRWHAVVAGALAGGVAVMFEKRSRRIAIAQQMFVRGLQGSWNAWSDKRGIHIPYGAVWLFSLCCGQIMYAALMRPDTMPRSYVNWIIQASHASHDAVNMNRQLIRTGTFDVRTMQKVIDKPNTTPSNRAYLMKRLADATATPPDWGYAHGGCESIHAWIDSCWKTQPDRFLQVVRMMLPVYGALHLIPTVLFKRATFVKRPVAMLLRALLGTLRSSTFLGIFVVIYQAGLCSKTNLHLMVADSGPEWLKRALLAKHVYWILGFCSGLSLFIEDARRRAELTMYVLPRGLESAWAVARGRGLVGRTTVPGISALTAMGMGMLMATYQNDPQHLSGFVRRILYQFIGPN